RRKPSRQALSRRAAVGVVLRMIDEILLTEAAFGFSAGTKGLRHIGRDASPLAGQDVLTLVVASVRQTLQARRTHSGLRLLGHLRQLPPIRAAVDHLMRD